MSKYIVKLSDSSCRENLVPLGKVGNPQVLSNYIIVDTDKDILEIQAIEGVLEVHKDEKCIPSVAVNDPNAPQWALPWLSNTGGFSFENNRDGTGVDIYVLDTGVRETHNDLAGRVRTLWSFDGQAYSTSGYVPEHGTAAAACAAGTSFGVAKGATIVNLRIDWYVSTIVKCIDMIIKDHIDKPANRPSIISFSGGSVSSYVGEVFAEAVQYGIIVGAAAGNEGSAVPMHPASNMWVVGVGSINQNEQPPQFTNKGVPIYAPGQNITTAGVMSDSQSIMTSGTSFSWPYYAGFLACYLQDSDRFNSAALVSAFTHKIQMQYCDHNRVPWFNTGVGILATPSTRYQMTAPYYKNASFEFTNQEIHDFCVANEGNPQYIADMAFQHNIDLNRFVECLPYSAEEINGYFVAHNVRPWWIIKSDWDQLVSGTMSVSTYTRKSTPMMTKQAANLLILMIGLGLGIVAGVFAISLLGG